MRPKDYRRQNGCINCHWCFNPWNPESWEGYCRYGYSWLRLQRMYRKWLSTIRSYKRVNCAYSYKRVNCAYLNWESGRCVEREGICNKWRKRRRKF